VQIFVKVSLQVVLLDVKLTLPDIPFVLLVRITDFAAQLVLPDSCALDAENLNTK
jgi:hypothetical protein